MIIEIVANTFAASKNVKTDLLVAFRIPPAGQRYILVRPGYAEGNDGACSIWMGEIDRKLYVQKTLTHSVHDRLTKPKDILHYVPPDNVPKLVDNTKHPEGSKPVVRPRAKIEENIWSSVSEFINGPSLDRVIEDHRKQRTRIPEPAIWQAGLTLLTVVLEMWNPLAGSGRVPLLHNDIRDRNVVVRQNATGDESEFYLIDLGRSKPATEQQGSYRDLAMIAELLLSIMLCECITDQRPYNRLWQQAQAASQLSNWPYSPGLLDAIKRLYALDVAKKSLPAKAQVVAQRDKFKAQAESAKKAATQKGEAVALIATPRIPSGLARPMLFADENDDRYQKLLSQSSQACPTIEKIWIRAGSIDTWLQGQPLDVIRRDNAPVLADWVADSCWE